MTEEEFERLTKDAALQFLKLHGNEDARELAFRYNDRKDIPVRAISEQISCRKKGSKKLPSLTRAEILFDKIALEQSSGEVTAKFKQTLISGNSLIDLTGGLGADDIFLSKGFDKVIYCEQNPALFKLFNYNKALLGIKNIDTIPGDSIEILSGFPEKHFDWIYADPARRFEGRKAVGLQNCSPDIVKHLGLLKTKGHKILIKASPALEFEEANSQLPGLEKFIVVSVDGECKEILLTVNTEEPPPLPAIMAAVLDSSGGSTIITAGKSESDIRISEAPQKYFYEPDPAIIKARLTPQIAEQYQADLLRRGLDYLTSDKEIPDFPGRKFITIAALPYKKKIISEYLTVNKIKKANLSRRDFPDSPEKIKKLYRLEDGGSEYIFFTKNLSAELIAIFCRKA
ncbi:MAG: class I SAM-dependent methyltransferase [Syntrophothermus sp.]